jgi:zinc protease
MGRIDHRGIKTFYHFEKEAGNTMVGIETIQRDTPVLDTISLQKRMLFQDLSDRIVQNRLSALIRQPDTPFTTASIFSGRDLKEIRYTQISAHCSPENWESALALLEQALRKALIHGFSKAELDRVKKDFIADIDAAVSKSATRESTDLAGGIIRHLNADRVFMSPQQDKALFSPMVDDFTESTAHEVFKATWSADHRLVILTGNADIAKPDSDPEAQILSVFQQSAGTAVEKSEAIKAVRFPYLPEPESNGEIIRKKEIADLGILQIDFKNGVRLNLKKTDYKANEVLAHLSFGRGKSSEPRDKPGLSALSAAVINGSGLGTLDQDDLERALAGKNTSVGFGVDEDRFFLMAASVPEEVRLMFQLLHTHFKDPG